MNLEECTFPGCGAPTAVAWSTVFDGVDYDGSAALFEIDGMQCAVGHWATRVGEEVRDLLKLAHVLDYGGTSAPQDGIGSDVMDELDKEFSDIFLRTLDYGGTSAPQDGNPRAGKESEKTP